MKWADRYQRVKLEGWQSWWAWHPVYLSDQQCWVWLEWTQRRGVPHYDFMSPYIEWQYQQVRPARRWPV